MAYSSQSSGESNTILWLAGGAVLFYLWYEGYFTSTTTAADGTVDENGVVEPTTSVASGATTQSVNQAAGTSTVSSVAAGTTPSVTDLANESYYSWLASGAPLSTLEQIDAAAGMVESGYVAANTTTPVTSVASAATTPVTSVASATPAWVSTPSIDPTMANNFQGPDLAQVANITGATISGNVMTYPSGISYQLNNDGSQTLLTNSTNAQAAVQATPYAGYVNPYLATAPATSVASATPSSAGTKTANATPPIIVAKKLSSTPVSSAPARSVTSAAPNKATSVTSASKGS
jgi:hypothetical protein